MGEAHQPNHNEHQQLIKFIKRNIQTNNPKLKESAYQIYIRPLNEYAASVWDPSQKNILKELRNATDKNLIFACLNDGLMKSLLKISY